MKSEKKISRALSLVAAAAVALTVTLNFSEAQVTPKAVVVPNSFTFSYNLPAGAASGAVTLPANVPVQIMGVQLNLGFRGVGQVTALRIPGSFLEWVGLDSPAGAAITQGFSGSAGTKIVFIDFSHQVQIEVASPDAIRVHNNSTGQRSGVVNLSW